MALRNQEIAARLRELRGLRPQTTVADELGVAERTYQNWEAGDAKPSYRNLQRLAEFYGVGEEFILSGEGSNAPAPKPATTPDPFAGQDALADRLDAIMQRLDAMSERQSRIEDMINDGLGQLAQALSSSAVEQADRIVQGIVADVRSGKLTVPPPRSKPRATKRAAKRTRAA